MNRINAWLNNRRLAREFTTRLEALIDPTFLDRATKG